MNTWDVRPRMVVAVRADSMSPMVFEEQAVVAVALDSGIGIEDTYKHEPTGYWIYATGSLDPGHIDIVLSSLEDHMENIPTEELDDITGNLWGGCINLQHMEEGIECCSQLDDCGWANVGTFTYYGPNCTVEVYYISE